MAIKRIIWLIGILLPSFSMGQNMEQQLKFVFPDSAVAGAMLKDTSGYNGLSIHYHTTYIYYDLYLDDPDQTLLQQGYSLRFRKRIMADTLISYGMQLKTEMTDENALRMEVEETELDFYRVNHKESWISLTVILDTIFNRYEKAGKDFSFLSIKNEISLIGDWMRFKGGGSIAPFQKLRFHNPELFTVERIQSFRPVACGKSIRHRGHVYYDRMDKDSPYFGLLPNRIKTQEIPEFFKKNPNHNWMFEVSLDSSMFVVTKKEVRSLIFINEFEVENKYYNKEKGADVLKSFSESLVDERRLRFEMASKYKQSMIKLD